MLVTRSLRTRTRHFILHTLGIRFFLAFFAACGLWTWRTELGLHGGQSVLLSVPVFPANVPSGLVVLPPPQAPMVQLQLTIPPSEINTLSSTQFSATVDLNGQSVGNRQYLVHTNSVNPDYVVRQISPAAITLTLESLTDRQLSITPVFQGATPSGYTYSQTPLFDTKNVIIKGPASLVQNVATVIAPIHLDGHQTTFHDTVHLVLQNAQGGDVSSNALQINPADVGVTEPVQQQAITRSASIIVVTKGQPFDGYVGSGITVSPATATIAGTPEVLAQTSSISTEPIDLTGATGDINKEIGLQLPSGIAVVGKQTVQVTIHIQSMQGSVTVPVAIQVVGASTAGLVQLGVRTVNISFEGSVPQLKAFSPDNVVTVDIHGLDPGSYDLMPLINIPQGLRVISVTPSRVPITILSPPTVTPRPVPTATSTPRPIATPQVPTASPTR